METSREIISDNKIVLAMANIKSNASIYFPWIYGYEEYLNKYSTFATFPEYSLF